MKVLRPGPPWTLEIGCIACGSLLLVEEGDVTLEPSKYGSKPGGSGGDYGEHYCKCAQCSHSIHLTQVPEHVMKMARAKAKWNVGQ